MECIEDPSCDNNDLMRLHDLPDLPLSQIFQYLSLTDKLNMDEAFSEHANVQKVLWRIFELRLGIEYSEDPSLVFYNGLLSFSDLLWILEKTRGSLRRLSFSLRSRMELTVTVENAVHSISSWDHGTFLKQAIENCHNLTCLELYLEYVMGISFFKLIEANKKLEKLVLHVVNMSELEHQQLSTLLEGFPKLHTSVSAYRYTISESTPCAEFLPGRFHLEKMFGRCMSLTQKTYMSDLFMQQLTLSHNLRVLHLQPPVIEQLWTVENFKMIAQLKNLTELNIRDTGFYVTDEVMSAILEGCAKLETIALSYLEHVSAECMNTIMTSSASLKAVKLNRVKMCSLLHDGKESKVESLYIDHCCIRSESESRKIANFPNLKSLHLLDCNFPHFHPNALRVSNEILSSISRNCRKLEKVVLKTESRTLDDGIASLAGLPNLKSCHFSGSRITSIYPEKTIPPSVHLQSSSGMENRLAEHLSCSKLPISNISSLKIVMCAQLSESSLIRAITHMPCLETFQIEDYKQSMTDEVITSLISSCPRLRTLHLRGCAQVTSSGINDLTSCHSLVNLSLDGLILEPFPLSAFVKPNFRSLILWDLVNIPEDFVVDSVTPEMENSLYTLMYDGYRLI